MSTQGGISAKTETLRSTSKQITDISSALATSKGVLLDALQGIYDNVKSEEISPQLKGYNDTLKQVCEDTTLAIKLMNTFLDEQIQLYEKQEMTTGDAMAQLSARLREEFGGQ